MSAVYIAAAIAVSVLVLGTYAYQGWRLYLAHRERLTNESLAAMRGELEEWKETVRQCVDEVNVLKRSSAALLPRGRNRGGI